MKRDVFILVSSFLVGIGTALVEPPTNVTLDCHNLVHIVRWSYADLSPGLQFRIFIGTFHHEPKEFLVDSPNLQANFSLETNPADTHSLVITAVVGENDSAEAPPGGIHFSYNKNSAATKICFVDLPAVNFTATQDGKALLSFMHPWLLYRDNLSDKKSNKTKEKRHSARSNDIPAFDYKVVIVSKRTCTVYFCEESVCEEELSVDPGEEELCVTISGEMNKMAVQGTQEYCTIPRKLTTPDDFTYVYVVVTLLVLIALAFILFMVYKKLTRPSSSLPPSMEGWKDHFCRVVGVAQEQVSVPKVEPASPTPLLPATEVSPPFTETEVREHIGVFIEDEGVCDDDDDEQIRNDEGAGYTQGRNLDEDDTEINAEASSGYEKRPGFDEAQDG